MVTDENGQALPRLSLPGQAELSLLQGGLSAADRQAVDQALDHAIAELVKYRGCRNVHSQDFLPFLALGMRWGDPSDAKSWLGTPLEAIYTFYVGRLPHSDAMVKSKLVAGTWLRTRVEASRYHLRAYKADEEIARMYFVSPDDSQPPDGGGVAGGEN